MAIEKTRILRGKRALEGKICFSPFPLYYFPFQPFAAISYTDDKNAYSYVAHSVFFSLSSLALFFLSFSFYVDLYFCSFFLRLSVNGVLQLSDVIASFSFGRMSL